MTPSGLSKISKKDRSESLVVLLEISEEIRRERMSKRRDADDVDRRIIADELDFSEFKDYDYLISEPFFTDLPNFLMDFKNKNQEV
jgi:dephospho-CoA kinase